MSDAAPHEDQERPRTVPIPPASIYDARLTDFDRKILSVICDHADWRTFTTDICQVQVAQAINGHLRSINRSFKRLFEADYLRTLGKNRHNAHKLWVNVANNPGETAGSQVAAGETVGSQVGETVGSQSASASRGPRVLDSETVGSHSSPSFSEQEQQQQGRTDAAANRGGEVDYWDQPLLESDLEPSTPLVVFARSIGFARENGKDALQEQHRVFLKVRAKNANAGHPIRLELKRWLVKQAETRSKVIALPETKSRSSDAPKPNDGPVTIHMKGGVPGAWFEPLREISAHLEKSLGRSVVINWFGVGKVVIEHADGIAILRGQKRVIAERIEQDYRAELRTAFAKFLPGVQFRIEAPTRGGIRAHAAE